MVIPIDPLIAPLYKLKFIWGSKMVAITMMVLNSAQYFSNLANILIVMLFIESSPFSISYFNTNLTLTTLGK